MTKAAIPVVFGILIGFIATYLLVRDRDPGPLIVPGVADSAPPAGGTEAQRDMIAELELRLAQNPNDFLLLSDLGNLHFEIQDFPGAIGYYERALAIAPDDANIRTDLGTALYYSDSPAEALAEFERSLELEPGHPQTLFNMGVVLLESRNDTEGAIELWERLIEMNPGYPQNPMVQQEIDQLRGLNLPTLAP